MVGLIALRRCSSSMGTLSYILREGTWGNGYATEAVRYVVDFAFTAFRNRKYVCTAGTASGAGGEVTSGRRRLRHLQDVGDPARQGCRLRRQEAGKGVDVVAQPGFEPVQTRLGEQPLRASSGMPVCRGRKRAGGVAADVARVMVGERQFCDQPVRNGGVAPADRGPNCCLAAPVDTVTFAHKGAGLTVPGGCELGSHLVWTCSVHHSR